MTNALPKISLECLLATMQKATQDDPGEFAIATMTGMAADQPHLMAAVQQTVGMFLGDEDQHFGAETNDGEPMPEMVPTEFAKEMICMSTFCILGIAMKAVAATLEAAELEEQWGSSDDDE